MAELHEHGPVNFDVLAQHYCFAYQGDPSDPQAEEKRAEFRTMLDEFEAREGRIRSQFWCDNVRAAAILTDKDRFFSAGNPYNSQADVPLGRMVGRAEATARLAEELLSGPARRTSLELLFTLETNALECMDQLASTPAPAPSRAKELRQVAKATFLEDLEAAERYVTSAVGHRARLVYLQGMVIGIVGVGVIASVLVLFVSRIPQVLSGTELVPTTLLLGAAGAIVSVMQRWTQGDLRVRPEPGPTTVRLLGIFRTVIGSVLAVAVLILVLGGLLPLSAPTDAATRAFFFAGLAFLAGFSERFAQDMIGTGKTSAAATELRTTSDASRASDEPAPAG
jgi:hypothetical protein